MGVEPKSGVDGIVDFPAMLDGELVYLCWKYGEPEILLLAFARRRFCGTPALGAAALPITRRPRRTDPACKAAGHLNARLMSAVRNWVVECVDRLQKPCGWCDR